MNVSQKGDRVRVSLDRWTARSRNIRGALSAFGDYRQTRHEEIFDKQCDPYGKKHAALKPATLRRKRQLGYDRRILHATLKLRGSFDLKVRGRSVDWGYTQPYAIYHVRGTAKMPKRSPLEDSRGLAPQDARKLKQDLKRWIFDK